MNFAFRNSLVQACGGNSRVHKGNYFARKLGSRVRGASEKTRDA